MCAWVFMKQNSNQRTLKWLQGWVLKCKAIPEADCVWWDIFLSVLLPFLLLSNLCSFSQSCFLTKLDLYEPINSVSSFFTQPTLACSFRHWILDYLYHIMFWSIQRVEAASLIEEAYWVLCRGYFFLLRSLLLQRSYFFIYKLTHLSSFSFLWPMLNTSHFTDPYFLYFSLLIPDIFQSLPLLIHHPKHSTPSLARTSPALTDLCSSFPHLLPILFMS